MSLRFVEIPADRFQASLDVIGDLVVVAGGSVQWTQQGRERVWELTLPGKDPERVIRVYTSMAVGAVQARDCGQDAVRIVVGFREPTGARSFRPLEKGQKILRTAPRGAQDRVEVFLERLRDQLRKAWFRASGIRACSECGSPTVIRKGKFGDFLGCSGYPKCQRTAPLTGG